MSGSILQLDPCLQLWYSSIMKFEFELDDIDSDALFNMINRRRLYYMECIMDHITEKPVCHGSVSHLIGLIRNADHIETTVFNICPPVHTDLSSFDEYNTVTFPED